jgi:hypothetical protein
MTENPIVNLIASFLAVVFVILAGAIAKRYMEPIKRMLEGKKDEPDVRQMLERIDQTSRTGSENAAQAVKMGVQVRQDLQGIDTRLTEQVRQVDTRLSAEVSELRGEVRIQGGSIRALQATATDHTDQLARMETVQARRGVDKVLQDAAFETRRAQEQAEAQSAAGGGESPRGSEPPEGSAPRPQSPTVARPGDGNSDS